MKLIKSALRNRLYIETLDALMTISLVGPDYVSNQDDGIFKEALSEWQGACARNPRQARFSNQNACKRRAQEARTELPSPSSAAEPPTEQCAHAAFELDEMADGDEERAANVFCDSEGVGGSTTILVPPYKPLPGFSIAPAPPLTSNQHMKNRRIAYKFETEWLVGTFRGPYKGKKEAHKGLFAIYFDRKTSFYLDLDLNSYGCDKDWVIITKQH